MIFVTNNDNIIINCKNISKPLEVSVEGTDIFNLDNKCKANTNDGTMLIAKRKITSKIFKDFIPKLNNSIFFQFQMNSTKMITGNLFPIEKNKNQKLFEQINGKFKILRGIKQTIK